MILRNKQSAILVAMACNINKSEDKHIVFFKKEKDGIYYTVEKESYFENMAIENWRPVKNQGRFYINNIFLSLKHNETQEVFRVLAVSSFDRRALIRTNDEGLTSWVSYDKGSCYSLYMTGIN
jgi:hypothetical protein